LSKISKSRQGQHSGYSVDMTTVNIFGCRLDRILCTGVDMCAVCIVYRHGYAFSVVKMGPWHPNPKAQRGMVRNHPGIDNRPKSLRLCSLYDVILALGT
jgi:hypothetical protein